MVAIPEPNAEGDRQHDGVFPINLEHPDQLAELAENVRSLRAQAGVDPAAPFDVIASLPAGVDPAPYVAAGATWGLVEFPSEGGSADLVRGVIRDGPSG